MLDHLLGRPSASYKRSHALLVVLFWAYVLVRSPAAGPRVANLRRFNRLLRRFTPWQIICATLTAVYALRHVADLVGLGSPEPLSRLYSRSYYRATWVATAFDVGLATAMPIRPKWVRDLAGFLLAGYYIIYANEADEKLRKFRSEATVEMLRTTWEKPLNPYVRLITRPYRPSVPVVRTLLIPRPAGPRAHLPPIKIVLFFDGPPASLSAASEVILDFPGGGFICMGPGCHEERLRYWARRFGRGRKEGTGRRIVVSVDYGKSPEYPYPWAIDECFDLYLAVVRSNGAVLGLAPAGGTEVELVLTGDSAGANIVCTVLFSLLESPLGEGVRRPKAIVLAYAALDFNFTSWMSQENLRVLREETGVKRRTASGADLSGLEQSKDHLAHRSPLAVVHDLPPRRALKRTKSWSQMAFGFGASLTPLTSPVASRATPSEADGGGGSSGRHKRAQSTALAWEATYASGGTSPRAGGPGDGERAGGPGSNGGHGLAGEEEDGRADEWKALRERVRTPVASTSGAGGLSGLRSRTASRATVGPASEDNPFDDGARTPNGPASTAGDGSGGTYDDELEPSFGTQLTMTSRSSYFQDRIITPSMMRAMAILYIGPSQNPDLHSDYYISPILAPARLLAQFPPALLVCGEKDPFVDDTVIIAGRIREARKEAGLEDAGEGGEWVRMEIMEGWGHGYLQMVALMPEIKGVLEDIAEYMDDAFVDNLFPGSTTSTSLSHSPAVASTTTPAAPSTRRSWLSRLLGTSTSSPAGRTPDELVTDVEMPTPVTPPPSVVPSPPAMRSPPTITTDLATPPSATLAPAFAHQARSSPADDEGEMLAFTPKRLRSPPLHGSASGSPFDRSSSAPPPRHGILKKPPPPSIALPPPFVPHDVGAGMRSSSVGPTPSSASAGQQPGQQPNAKTLPSLLAAALTRSLTPPSSSLPHAVTSAAAAAAAAGTPVGPGTISSSALGTPMLGPGGGAGKARRAALDEKELLRRRRVDAVFGMDIAGASGGEDGGGGAGTAASAAAAKKDREKDAAGVALEEEMEEFLL